MVTQYDLLSQGEEIHVCSKMHSCFNLKKLTVSCECVLCYQGFPGSHPGYQIGSPMGPQMGQQLGPHINPQMGPQMRPQMGPQMGPSPNTQMGLNIGTFPSNVQLGHQFPKQQQRLIEQQRKHAEEELKKQEELMKKKQLEAERRKLQQSFSAKKLTNADALNNLFGKNKKSAGYAMTDLIGSLGKDASIKPAAASKSTSICKKLIVCTC